MPFTSQMWKPHLGRGDGLVKSSQLGTEPNCLTVFNIWNVDGLSASQLVEIRERCIVEHCHFSNFLNSFLTKQAFHFLWDDMEIRLEETN